MPGVFFLCGNILFIISLSQFQKKINSNAPQNIRYNSTQVENNEDQTSEPILKTTLATSVDCLPASKLNSFGHFGATLRRFTLGSISNSEILIQIKLSQKAWMIYPSDGKRISGNGEWERSFTINLSNVKLCEECHKILDPKVMEKLVNIQCCCSLQRSKSLPVLFTNICKKKEVFVRSQIEKNNEENFIRTCDILSTSRECKLDDDSNREELPPPTYPRRDTLLRNQVRHKVRHDKMY